jgi:hypothetical protein
VFEQVAVIQKAADNGMQAKRRKYCANQPTKRKVAWQPNGDTHERQD